MKIDLVGYQEYRDSGAEMIGEIPHHWEIRNINRASRILRGKFTHRPRNDPKLYDGKYPFIQTGDVANAKRYVTDYEQTLNELGLAVSKKFPKCTLVMTIAANIGDVAILDFEACFPDSVVGFVPEKGVSVDYLFYLFSALKPQFLSAATLGTQLNLNIERISNARVLVPPIAEQKAIVTFLDRETAKIDRLAETRRKQIECLQEQRTAVIHHAVTKGLDPAAKMKPSGIDWLGDIPESWEIHRLRRTATPEIAGIWGDEPEGGEDDIICIRVADFDRLARRIKSAERTFRSIPKNKRGKRLLKSGDLLIEKSGGGEQTPVGCVVLFNGEEQAITSNFIAKITPLDCHDSRFLCYLHQVLYDARITMLSVKQTTGIQNLDTFWYLDAKAAIPHKAEQIKIADYIEEEAGKIDTLIEKYRRELEYLAEYRAALISHAVTGKIDVRGMVESPSY